MISIIVPIYNAGNYLPQCIESIIRQTYPDIEIILVDDGSDDESGTICDRSAEKDPRIIVIHKKNEGLVKARKEGLKTASGEYIAFVDADDWIEPDMYERMYARMTEENADVVMCGRCEVTGDISREVFHGIPEGRYGKQELAEKVYPQMIVKNAFFEWGIFPGLWDKLFRRDCLEKFQMEVDDRIVMGEDAACAYPCLLNVESIYVMRECLYHYRQTASSMVKRIMDCQAEREQFRVLYQTVNKSFEKYAEIFDLRQQWKKYILFLMTARSTELYKGYEELDFLFPFSEVKKGSDIILYGAGTFGRRLYHFLQRTGFCRVTAWVDRNYAQLQNMGLAVSNPEVIQNIECDTIVIANTYEKSRNALQKELLEKYPGKQINLIDKELIFSQESMEAFGLMEQRRDNFFISGKTESSGIMYSYDAIKNIYIHMQDEVSKFIFLKRLEYSLSGKMHAVEEIVGGELERHASQDIMNRLFFWLAEHTGEVVIFGAGFAGKQINFWLQKHNIEVKYFADNNKSLWNSEKEKIKIIPPEMIDRDSLVIIGVNSCADEIYAQLLLLGIEKKNIFMPDKQWWIGDHPQYFAPEIMHPETDEVFVDGGSLDGGDIFNFIKWCGGKYRAAYAFEPDTRNCENLFHSVEGYRGVEIFEEGLWSGEGELSFLSGERENCAVSDMGDTTIKVTSIDKKLRGLEPTFIKMDIEGSEMKALCGAEKTIREYRPKLAICVYHKPEDILDIPQKILELNPEYRLYLRHYSYLDTETVLYAV